MENITFSQLNILNSMMTDPSHIAYYVQPVLEIDGPELFARYTRSQEDLKALAHLGLVAGRQGEEEFIATLREKTQRDFDIVEVTDLGRLMFGTQDGLPN